ncbi:MAG: ETC complex I subunit [Methylobacteriaceae bacterium]|jgi:hypothetical protein|nr:ETC complex I subunit [Methylobacteriaceae bacterium]
MTARIFKPAKPATQSGTGGTTRWVLENERQEPDVIDPLMGWTGSADTSGQVRLTFATREEAEAYAKRNGLDYVVETPPEPRKVRPVCNYSDNFRVDRFGPWTH